MSTMFSVRMLDTAVQRTPLGQHGGYSGAHLERAVLADGTVLIVKRLSPAMDLTMRLTHDRGRAATLWTAGVFERFPPVIEHATLAVEPDGDGWLIVMRDVSAALLDDERVLMREESRRILAAAAALHEVFHGERVEGLCSLTDHLSLFTPATAARERPGPQGLFDAVARGWELFAHAVPRDVAAAVFAVHEHPDILAGELERCGTTLIHGDLWLANTGLFPDRVVMLDWGLATRAPAEFELTLYLTGNWSRIAATREQIIEDFRAVRGARFHARALEPAFLATFAEYGWNKALDALTHPDAAVRAREAAELTWWVRRVRAALARWAPSGSRRPQ
jgi:hypothetical protein